MVAVMVMIKVSRFFTCANSCAITPAISSWLRLRSNPVVSATEAFSRLRPVANAFGWSFSMMKNFGIGSSARLASCSTRR